MNSTEPNPVFQREDRYLTIKRKDTRAALSLKELDILDNIQNKVNRWRNAQNKPVLQCVVVEADWPEYEAVWLAIQHRMNQPKPLKVLDWEQVPPGVCVSPKYGSRPLILRRVRGLIARCENREGEPVVGSTKDLTLAPAEAQPWVALQDHQQGLGGLEALEKLKATGITAECSAMRIRVTGLAAGWGYGGAK